MEFFANYKLFGQRGKLYIRGYLELLARKIVISIYKLQRNATSPVLRWEKKIVHCATSTDQGTLGVLSGLRLPGVDTLGIQSSQRKKQSFFKKYVLGSGINFSREKGHARPALVNTQNHSLGRPCNVFWWGVVGTNWPEDALSYFADLIFSCLYVVLTTHIWKRLFYL